MKWQISLSNRSAKSQILRHPLLVIGNFLTFVAVNSISLSYDGAFAANSPSKVENSTILNEQNIKTSEPTDSPSARLRGKIKLGCETRLDLFRPDDCAAGEGNEPYINIPQSPIILDPNQKVIPSEREESQIIFFNIRF